MDKPCSLGPVGFPFRALPVAEGAVSLKALKRPVAGCVTGLPFRPHYNLQNTSERKAHLYSLGVFLDSTLRFLASFAMRVSRGDHSGRLAFAHWNVFRNNAPQNSRQATLYTAFAASQVSPQVVSDRLSRLPAWVSTEAGSTPACHCGSPHDLNSQHQLPTGRQQPTPETSSMCPSADF